MSSCRSNAPIVLSGVCCKELIIALAFSTLLTIALFYMTFEVPMLLDSMFMMYFPDVGLDVKALEEVLSPLRPVGYVALAMTILLIVLGFAIRKSFLSLLGSIALYVPTFGYFAYAMFFLAGLGVLRSLWLPILEYSPTILKLGSIAYLPFIVVPQAPLIGVAIVFTGLLIFMSAVTTWLYGRFKGYELIDFWIYKYSRHPQYLGFILWSYGLLIFVSYKDYVRGAFTTPPALIWLLTTMTVIGVALLEELEMSRKYGERYEEYRRRTPFMMPLPKLVVKVVTLPMKVSKENPKNVKDIAIVILLYMTILITTSYTLIHVLKI